MTKRSRAASSAELAGVVMRARGDVMSRSGRQDHVGGRVGRDREVELESVADDLPRALDRPADRAVTRLGPGDAAARPGANEEVLPAGSLLVGLDARDAAH